MTDFSNALEELSKRLIDNRQRIQLLLPNSISFATFHSSIITAIRKNPRIITCDFGSIFDAAVDSAIDGLLCDGQHAALVERTVNVGTKNSKKYVQFACYQPMAYGIRKKIIESGAATQVDTVIVYANEICRVVRGTSPVIEHEQIIKGDRGEWVAVYSVAELPNGKQSIEFMTKADVMEVRKAAQTDYIWDQHETEMARKTVLRRHRKSLVGNIRVVDVEERRMVSMIERKAQAPAISAGQASPRPTREALENHSNQIPVNDFSKTDRGEVQIEEKVDAVEDRQPQEQAPAEVSHLDMPQSPAEFDLWAADMKFIIKNLLRDNDVSELKELRRSNAPIIEAAPEDVRNEVEGEFTAALAELMTKES